MSDSLFNPKAGPCDEAAIRSVAPAPDCAARTKRWVLGATILASAIAYIDESVINIALPAIERDLAASVSVVQWLINAYTLCLTALVLLGGTAADNLGRRRVFIAGVGIFAAASICCGLSPNIALLILARAAQGVGAALLIPCCLALIGASFQEDERGKAIGTWAGASAIFVAGGPLLGGWIVDHFSWRWIFLINPLLALPVISIAIRHVPESVDPQSRGGLDWRGALLALTGLSGICFGLIGAPDLGWSDPEVNLPAAGGALLIGAFLWTEARQTAPMLPLILFRSRTFSVINLLTLLLYAAISGAFFFLPFALIQVYGYSALLSGGVFLPFTIVMTLLSRWAGGLLDRFGARLPLVIGPSVAALGFGLLGFTIIGGGAYWGFLVSLTVLGLGMAISVPPLTATVINTVPARQIGVASGINNAVASLAGLLAVAIFGALALGIYDRALDREITAASGTPQLGSALQSALGKFATAPVTAASASAGRLTAQTIIKISLAHSIEYIFLLAAALALCAAATGTLLPRGAPGAKRAR